jgi:hypothetical protein
MSFIISFPSNSDFLAFDIEMQQAASTDADGEDFSAPRSVVGAKQKRGPSGPRLRENARCV